MGSTIELTAADGHRLGAYRADPAGKSKGGVVVIREIFGVNHHIRAVCDRVAQEGYVAVAPALFDRLERDFQSGYTADEVADGPSHYELLHGRPVSFLAACRFAGQHGVPCEEHEVTGGIRC